MESFDKDSFNKAVDLALIDMKKKYIQKILDLYAKLKPDNDYSDVIYTIRFFDGSREKIRCITKDVWEFYDPLDDVPTIHICDSCKEDIIQDYIDEKFN